MTYQPHLDMRSQLRSAASLERDELVYFKLNTAQKALDAAIRAFQLTPNGDHLTTLNGAWVNAVRALDNAGLQAPMAPPKEIA